MSGDGDQGVQIPRQDPKCGTGEDSSALEIEQKRVHFGEFMMSGKECPELLLSELLMHKPVTVDGSEYLLSEVHQTVPESGKAVRVATSSQQAGRWMLHTEAEMEPVFLKTELVDGIWKNDVNTEQRGPPAQLDCSIPGKDRRGHRTHEAAPELGCGGDQDVFALCRRLGRGPGQPRDQALRARSDHDAMLRHALPRKRSSASSRPAA